MACVFLWSFQNSFFIEYLPVTAFEKIEVLQNYYDIKVKLNELVTKEFEEIQDCLDFLESVTKENI